MDDGKRCWAISGTLTPVNLNRLRRIARRQRGLFTREQARMCGFTPRQIARRLRSGAWQTVLGRVLAEAGLRINPRVRDWAAQLAVSRSVVAGFAAAREYGIPVPSGSPCIIVPPETHPRLAGVRILRTPVDRRDLRVCDGVPITNVERTIFDCLRLLPEREARDLLDRALQQGWITIDGLTDRIHRHTGYRGNPKLIRLLRGVTDGARSEAERSLLALLRESGIDGWSANRPIRDGEGLIGIGDIVFDAIRLVVEVDGAAHHTGPYEFQRDRHRQNRLVAAGWTVLRFTWRDIVERPEYVVATIRAMILRLSAS